ncbi:MAG: sulfatase [Actinomycetota bacterium]|nr:sulfatase [Actinomycetota bacterium]
MNLVMIVSDTFRADHLGAYGADWIRTPNLDALSRRSVLFANHHAASFPTMPARADFFLGKWTFTYRGWEPLGAGETTLAAVLSSAGYRTMGVADTPFYVGGGFAYDRGFHQFTDLDTQRRGGKEAPNHPQIIPRVRRSEYDYCAPRTMALAEQYLERLLDDRFFLLIDTWDPHEPWDPPAWYVRPYLPDYDGQVVRPPYAQWREVGLTEHDVAVAHACYAGEITMVDRWIGRVLERLESLGIADDTAIVFTSDHGYYFGEHGYLGKMVIAREEGGQAVWGRSPLYQEITHVPLLVSAPGLAPGRVDALTSAVDIMPTILDLLGVDVPADVHGQSLLPLARGGAGGRQFVVTSPPLANPGDPIHVVDDVMRYVAAFLPATVTTPDWTLLSTVPGEPVELYDMRVDPAQAQNVAAAHPDVVDELRGRFLRLLEDLETPEWYLGPRQFGIDRPGAATVAAV